MNVYDKELWLMKHGQIMSYDKTPPDVDPSMRWTANIMVPGRVNKVVKITGEGGEGITKLYNAVKENLYRECIRGDL